MRPIKSDQIKTLTLNEEINPKYPKNLQWVGLSIKYTDGTTQDIGKLTDLKKSFDLERNERWFSFIIIKYDDMYFNVNLEIVKFLFE